MLNLLTGYLTAQSLTFIFISKDHEQHFQKPRVLEKEIMLYNLLLNCFNIMSLIGVFKEQYFLLNTLRPILKVKPPLDLIFS